MTEIIIRTGQFLNPEKIRAYQGIVLLVHQVNLMRVEPSLRIRKNEHFVDFHAEQEFPSFILSICLINYRQSLVNPVESFIEGDHALLAFPVRSPVYGHMMVVAEIDVIGGYRLSAIIED